jgi:hypothetical protein
MAQYGRISMIKKDPQPGVITLTNALRENGYQRFPGTGRLISPFKENNGTYRTGLDENALYIRNIIDPEVREAEKRRVGALRKKLEQEIGFSLAPDSDFYRFDSNSPQKAGFFKLTDKDSVFDLSDPFQAVTFAWLRVHPIIASSLEAYNRGEFLPETQYFVNDDEAEAKISYSKKKSLNDAIGKLNSLSLERRRKIGRLMDLPHTDDTMEQVVYNDIDNLLRLADMPSGAYKGQTPLKIFNMFVDLNAESLDVKDLIEQAFRSNIYRMKKGKVYEGEFVAFESKDDLFDHLIDEANQKDRLELEKKLKVNKLKV